MSRHSTRQNEAELAYTTLALEKVIPGLPFHFLHENRDSDTTVSDLPVS
jgi:hypothetical protein